MEPKLLEEIGLTPGETRVYLALLELGATKTGPLAKKAQVSSSKVYKILDRLLQKGFVGYVKRGKISYFSALEPKKIMDYLEIKERQLEEKKQALKKIIPELELQHKKGKKTDAVIYEGFKAVTSIFSTILSELNKGETYYIIGAGYGDVPFIKPFFQEHHANRAKKGIKIRMLADSDTKKSLVSTTKRKAEIRYLPKYLTTNLEIVFYKDKSL